AAIKHFQNMVGPSQSPFKTLNSLPERWKNCYTPISSIDPDIYSMVMVPIGEDELLAVINNSPHHKAPVSLSAGNNLISFQLNSEFPDHLSSMGFSLRALRLSSSFRFLGVWFNLQGSPNFVLSQLKDIYSSFLASVRFKKLSPVQLAYLHSSVVLPKAQFRFQ
ncbi:775_t:CDS:2, partial [Rhizophagus irregularis]